MLPQTLVHLFENVDLRLIFVVKDGVTAAQFHREITEQASWLRKLSLVNFLKALNAMEDEDLLYLKLATYLHLPKMCQDCGILESKASKKCKFHASFLRVAVPKEFMPLVCGQNEEGLQQIESAFGIRPKVNDSEFWLQGKTSDVKQAFAMIHRKLMNKGKAVGTWNCCEREVRDNECTKRKSHVFPSQPLGKVFALDCEMVKTSAGKEIARVALLNFSGEICINEFVKPKNEIRDYGTKYSGITVDSLRGIETRLSDIQKSLNRLVSHNDILVGHSIDHDLKCLRWRHAKVAKKINTKSIFFLRLLIPALPFRTLMEAKKRGP